MGILGAGPVTQAIHLPSLARLRDILEVRHIMDVDPAVAESVAARVGARFSTSTEELLADPAVEIVAICSPHQFHAVQVIAACRAGKKAVLCEKPFAMNGEEAAAIAAVSAETGVPIVVGAMHTLTRAGWRRKRRGAACRNRSTPSGPRSSCRPLRGLCDRDRGPRPGGALRRWQGFRP